MKVTEISKGTEQFFKSVYPEIWSKYQEGDLFAAGQVEMYNLANELRCNEINQVSSEKMNLEILVSLIASKQDISKYIEALAKERSKGDKDVYEKMKKQLESRRWNVSDIEID